MFHGTIDEQKALTQELRDLALAARGLGSRLEMLLPHFHSISARDDTTAHAKEADFIADRLSDHYRTAVQALTDEVHSQ